MYLFSFSAQPMNDYTRLLRIKKYFNSVVDITLLCQSKITFCEKIL